MAPVALVNEHTRKSRTLLAVRDLRDKMIPDSLISQVDFRVLSFLSSYYTTHTHTPAFVFILNHPFMYCTASTLHPHSIGYLLSEVHCNHT
jgi:hypothetical protein